MARGKSITKSQERLLIKLYKDEECSIKKIMELTGIKSEQTVYRLLDQNGIPRRAKVNGVTKILVSLERDVADILIKKKNISMFVNNAIRFYVEQHTK
ncbi:hypothetical protein [Parabacteroides sp. AM08-6]|uniref:hypothetical protein n=1 Tax=Parabacteroides sp. AM08-6 TaxID=2292053 RepID=UPI000EFF9359|nr:hypothetical protein [Parabacteroides sp. AM08-6]RHJ76139.1 hypothetical protein DW103_17290 [Parabacteroides sp. AM08-6]